jgi:hypothetical protein
LRMATAFLNQATRNRPICAAATRRPP